jgi:hypothetical protein
MNGVSVMHRLLTPLTSLVRFVLSTRAAVAGSSRRTTLTAVLLLSVALPYTAQAYESKDELRLYAHSRIVEYKQFVCFNKLINAESNWRIDAINGSHYGIGQMRNPKYGILMDTGRLTGHSNTSRIDTPLLALHGHSLKKTGGIDVKSLEKRQSQRMEKDS